MKKKKKNTKSICVDCRWYGRCPVQTSKTKNCVHFEKR